MYSSLREKCRNYTGNVSLRREYLNNGGYTKDGVYFGVGDRLYYMADGFTYIPKKIEQFV